MRADPGFPGGYAAGAQSAHRENHYGGEFFACLFFPFLFIKDNIRLSDKKDGKRCSMSLIAFKDFFDRVRAHTDIATQTALARALGVHRSAITQAKNRDAIPPKWVLQLARRCSLSPDWLEFGTGVPRPVAAPPAAAKPGKRPPARRPGALPGSRDGIVLHAASLHGDWREQDIVLVPKVSARLCAGGGSFEVDAQPVNAHPFPRWWLAKMGSPSDMVFMDVVGDSMEPGICDGDTVLVDQSFTRVDSHAVLAVGLEDAIYLKRAERCGDGIILHSDNPAYGPMEIFGDELESFRVIGRVVWLCRDCR